MSGFFEESELLQDREPPALVARCGACGLNKTCRTPKLSPRGEGLKRILIVGNGPDSAEDSGGGYNLGSAGAYLRDSLAAMGVNLGRDCWTTGAYICHSDGAPKDEQIDHCGPNLRNTIEKLQPVVIIALGRNAIRALISLSWEDDVGNYDRWLGYKIPCRQWNAWICPTYHPREVAHEKKRQAQMFVWWNKYLKAAVELPERPWVTIPDENSEIECVFEPTRAAELIRGITERGGCAAFDYETESLKSQCEGQIVSCSISWRGARTIAYPWAGEAIDATREFLQAPILKIASNLQFEEQWSIEKLGTRVRGWHWDTLQMAHLIDHRPNTKSIKFQAYVLLGAPSWNRHIERFFESDGTMTKNRIHKVSMSDLLLYNGLDSLFEYRIAEKQTQILGVPLGVAL